MFRTSLLPSLAGTIANAVDFERLLVAIGDADDHVVQQSAGQAVQSAVLLAVVGTGNEKLSAFLLDGHARLELLGQGTLGPLTVTRLPSATVTSTPAGMATGILPILLIVLYPPYHTNARTSPPM